jgi:hypothetical protein
MVVIAHAGHWLAQVAFAAPLVLVVVALVVSKLRGRRSESEEPGAEGPPAAAGVRERS